MAATKKPIDAFSYAKRYIKNMPLEEVRTAIINRVSYYMWMYAPWRWTIGSTPTITLTANTSDYTMAYPSDWLYAIRATQTDGNNSERPLEIVPSLETNVGFIGNPNSIAYPAAAGSASGLVRVSPKPGALTGTQVIVGLYKKIMTPFTNETIFSGSLPFDDEWFMVFEEGVLWQAYLYADDRRAGEVSIDTQNNISRFTGQRAIFETALAMMKDREKLIMVSPFSVDQKDIRK
jgi:hypothetical protein